MIPLQQLAAVAAALASGALGALFLTAGTGKLSDGDGFISTLASYRLVPDWLLVPEAQIPAWLLGGAEVLLGLCLLTGCAAGFAGALAALLLLIFAAAMAINLLRGRDTLSCGCLPGGAGETLSWRAVLRNLAFTVIACLPVLTGLPANIPLRMEAVLTGACLFVLALAARRLATPEHGWGRGPEQNPASVEDVHAHWSAGGANHDHGHDHTHEHGHSHFTPSGEAL